MFARFFADKKEGKCLAVAISPQRDTEAHRFFIFYSSVTLCGEYRLFFRLVFQYVAGLAIQFLADGPGWQFSSLQMASSVEKRTALAFPVFRIERFAGVRSIRSASSPSEIFRFAIITSRFTIIGISIIVYFPVSSTIWYNGGSVCNRQ